MKTSSKAAVSALCFALFTFAAAQQSFANSETWITLSPEGQGFSVEFPGEPKTLTTLRRLSPTDSLSSNNYRLELDNTTYSIKVSIHVPTPPTAPAEIFDAEEGFLGFKEGLLQLEGIHLLSEKEISSTDGTPGREYTTSSQGTETTVIHIFYTEKRMFALSVANPAGQTGKEKQARFLTSFTITSH